MKIGNIHAGRSLLFIFAPAPICDHYKRPLTYDFNHQFVTTVDERMVSKPTMNAVNTLMKDPVIIGGIKPSYNGFNVKTSNYSNNWTFVLIVDENNSTIKLPSRSIFYGIFMDEPLSNVSSATPEKFINHNCQTVITKKTFINSTPMTVAGRPNHVVMEDVNVVNFDDNAWNTSDTYESFFTMKPADVAKSISFGGAENIVVEYDESLNLTGSASIKTAYETPMQHMKSLLSDVTLSVDNIMADGMIGDFDDSYDTPFVDCNFALDATDTIIGHDAINDRMVASRDQLGENSVITLGNVYNRYVPQILPFNITLGNNDVIPQDISSINNIFSSLVCSCIPSYMNNVGLTSVSFAYNSATDSTQVMLLESMFDDPQNVLKTKWGALMTCMKTELFPVLLINGGQFDLTVIANMAGTIDVILNFLDYTLLPYGAAYQENCMLGGINSSLVGTSQHVSKNAAELLGLFSNIDASLTPGGKNEVQIY